MTMMTSLLLALLLLRSSPAVTAFVVPRNSRQHLLPQRPSTTGRFMTAVRQESEVERLQQEALKMRLQAQEMETDLLKQKIESMEKKLQDERYMERQTPSQQRDLQEQLQRLQSKLKGGEVTMTINSESKRGDDSPKPRRSYDSSPDDNPHIPPMAGFDQDDLDLYVPVAKDINKMTPNATLQERLQLFQTAPELEQHFRNKITRLIMGPLEELQRLEDLKSQYLDTNSSLQRRQLKKQIDQLERSLKNSGTVADIPNGGEIEISVGESGTSTTTNRLLVSYSDTFQLGKDILPPLTEQELEERYRIMADLPDILIAIYKQRTGVDSGYNFMASDDDDDDDNITHNLKMAIQLDYYGLQLQLLEQARDVEPFTDKDQQDFCEAFGSLPRAVQQCFAVQLGIAVDRAKECTAEQVLRRIRERATPFSTMLQVVDTADSVSTNNRDSPEYNDIEFVDRSRYLEEFFPAVASMEGSHPRQEDVDLFVTDCLAKSKAFMVTSKPERVIGGYYVRGQNQLTDTDDNSGPTASERLVKDISQRLQAHPQLKEKVDFFYILDPSPPSDEEMEMGTDLTPVLLVTTKDPKMLYNTAAPFTKVLVSAIGLASALFFSIGCCVLNPAINDRVFNAIDTATASADTTVMDLKWFWDLCLPLYGSILGILVMHELGHRIVASQYKFEIGLPNVIPSITQGVAGSITPLKSPPPSNKALFDFSIAGPLAGLVASVTFLLVGLELTQSSSLDSALPVLPVGFVRSSSLGGGLVEFFLGKVALLPDQGPNAEIQLHPFAIGGFLGCLVNALAMLPLGHTDGGRISLAMFGRRGAFVIKLFTTLLLTLAGLFGLDDNNILLAYVLYTLVWQRELETPMRNEVDEIDFTRGLLGISGALLVGLVLIPML